MANPIKDVVERAGGTTAVATMLGVPITTVHAWTVKGKVPKWRTADLAQIAAAADALDRLTPARAEPAPVAREAA